jgi:hypothetical protein
MTRNRKDIVAVVNRSGKSYWTRIGVAFENVDSSWTLRFEYLPTSGGTTIQLREPRSGERAPTEVAASAA